MRIGHKWSLNSRLERCLERISWQEKEDLIKYANSFNADLKPDYFIFGHRHLAKRITLKNNSEMILLGDWIKKAAMQAGMEKIWFLTRLIR